MKPINKLKSSAYIILTVLLLSCTQNSSFSSDNQSEKDSSGYELSGSGTDPELLAISDSLKNHIIDSLLAFTASPYFMGYETPGVLQATATNLNALIVILGGNILNIPTPPQRETYFKDLKASISLGSVNSLRTSDQLCELVDSYFPDTKKASPSAQNILQELSKLTMSAKMKAVREKDRERILVFGRMNKMCNDAIKFSESLKTFFQAAGTIKECLKLVIRIMEPLQAYEGAEVGLRAIYANKEGMSPELSGAISDVISLLDNIESTILVNLRNSNSELFSIVVNLAEKLYEENYEHIEKVISGYIGKSNFKTITQFLEGRKSIRELFGPLCPKDESLDQIVTGYNATMLENGIHRAIYENIKKNSIYSSDKRIEYYEAFRILLLTESLAHDRLASFFNSLPSTFGMGATGQGYKNVAEQIIFNFNELAI